MNPRRLTARLAPGWDADDPLKYFWNSIEMDVQPAYHRRRAEPADG